MNRSLINIVGCIEPDGMYRGSATKVRTSSAITSAIAKTLIFSKKACDENLGSRDLGVEEGSAMGPEESLQPVEYSLPL